GAWSWPPPLREVSVKINSDFRDLLRNFNAAGVRYLIVGGYAVMVHTEPRYTKDLDLWIDRDEHKPRAVLAARAPSFCREICWRRRAIALLQTYRGEVSASLLARPPV